MYSVEFAARSPTPVAAARKKPAVETGTAVSLMAASGTLRHTPRSAQVNDGRPAEQRSDPEDVQKIDDRIGPEAGGPHQFAKRGLLQPDESVAHYFLSGYTLNSFPLYVTRSVFTSKRFGSRWR